MANRIYDDENTNHYRVKQPGGNATEDLKQRESAVNEDSSPETSEDAGGHGASGGVGQNSSGWYKPSSKTNSSLGGMASAFRGGSKAKKAAMVIGAGGVIPLVVGIMLILVFVGQLRAIHFATVMRSVGFAQFQLTMNRVYTQVVFDRAILVDGSQGQLKLKGDPFGFTQKRLGELGRQDKLKWDVHGDGSVKSVIIDGKTFSFDEYASRLFGKKSFKDLGIREKWTVQSRLANDISSPLSDIVGNKSLFFRSRVYSGLRQAGVIQMYKWVNRAKAYFGKTPKEALSMNIDETILRINGRPLGAMKGATTIDDEDTNKTTEQTLEAAKDGKPTASVKPSATKSKISKVASTASEIVFAVTLVCVVHDLDTSFKEVQTQRELGSLRMSHDVMTMADQKKIGHTVNEATSAENTVWDASQDSAWYRQDVGEKLTGADADEISKIPSIYPSNLFVDAVAKINEFITQAATGPVLSQIGPKIPGYTEAVNSGKTAICSVALNDIVQYTTAGAEIAVAIATAGTVKGALLVARTAVVGLLTEMVQGDLIGRAIDLVTKNYSGTEYTGVANGSQKYTEARAGTNYMQQIGNRRMAFGAPLTPEQAATNQEVAMAQLRLENNSGGLYARYLAISNPFSLMSQIVSHIPTSAYGVRSKVISLVSASFSSLTHPWKLIPQSFMPRAFADDTNKSYTLTGANVGVLDFGYTQEEMQKIDSDPSFRMESLERDLGSQLDALDAKYMPCYQPFLQSELPEQCKKAEFYQGDNVLKWRWYRALKMAEDEGERGLQSFTGLETEAAALAE